MKYIICLLSLSCLLSCHPSPDQEHLASISTLPSFEMLLMDSTIFQAAQIPEGNSIVMLYFRPDCVHCQAETKLIISNIEALKNVKIYLLAGARFEDIKSFYTYFHLDRYPNILVGKDYDHSFAKVFHPSSIPYTAVFNGQKKLVRLYYGEIGLNNLLAANHG